MQKEQKSLKYQKAKKKSAKQEAKIKKVNSTKRKWSKNEEVSEGGVRIEDDLWSSAR